MTGMNVSTLLRCVNGKSSDAEALFEALRALFIAQVMDEREFDRWRDRLNQAFPPPE